jgi:O-antigen ligase
MQVSWDNGVYYFIKVLVLFSMILGSIKNEQDIKIFVWSFIVMFTYLAYEPVYGFLTGTGASWHSYGEVYTSEMGVLSGHVALANNMNQCIPIVFFLIFGIKNKILRSLGIFIFLILFFALVASKSRGGVAGLIFFAGCAAYFSKKRMRNAIAIGMACVLIFILSGSLKSTADRINSSAVRSRLIGFIHGIEMVRIKGRVLGVGPGCFSLARKTYFDYRLESHNIYGELIGDLGIPGTIAWFFLIRQIFINLITSKRKLKQLSMENHFLFGLATGLQVSLLVRLFISLASHGLYYFYWYVIAALSIMTLKLTERLSSNCFINQGRIETMQSPQNADTVSAVSL